jgi:hypothetical protein
MYCYILHVSEKDTYRYAHTYARDTAECISDMTRAYEIYKLLYQPVCACIGMYIGYKLGNYSDIAAGDRLSMNLHKF